MTKSGLKEDVPYRGPEGEFSRRETVRGGDVKRMQPGVPTRRRRVLLAFGWYSSAIHQGVVRYGKQANWIMDMQPLRAGQIPKNWQGDGIICGLGIQPALDRAVKRFKGPIVVFGYGAPRVKYPRVVHDNEAIGRLAADHFWERGFRHFAVFRHDSYSGSGDRLVAFRKRVEPKATSFDVLNYQEVIQSRVAAPDPITWLARELVKLPLPLAILADFDDSALEVIDACAVAGLRVPEQVAVMGVDNDSLRCETAAVPLTSIDNNMELMGYETAALLDRLIQKKPLPSLPVKIPPQGVVVRKSTDVLAIPHVPVAMALRWIGEHFMEAITARDVARGIPLSARRLHDAFVKHVGRSMAAEILRRRLEGACRLLRETPRKVYDIACASGFGNADRMARLFRQNLGISPAHYRRREKGTGLKEKNGGLRDGRMNDRLKTARGDYYGLVFCRKGSNMKM